MFDNEIDKFSQKIYENFKSFYEEQIINYNRSPCMMKNISNFLIKREKYIIEINNLLTEFKNLIIGQSNLKEKEKKTDEKYNIFNRLEEKAKNINEKEIF